MTYPTLLAAAPLGAALIWAAASDLRARRIPNVLTFALIACGFAQSFTAGGTVSPGQALGGFAVGFALPFALFAIGALGGGDVKLLAGVGAWLGAPAALCVFAVAAVVGMVIVLAQAAVQGRFNTLLRNTAVVGMNLMHLRDVGVEHAAATGRSCRSVDRPLPYAVPVLIATAIVVAAQVR